MEPIFIYLSMFVMFLGIFASFLVPYLRKTKEDKIHSLELKYIGHLIVTAIWQFILGLPLYAAWQPPDAFNIVFILILAFSFGYGGAALQKELEKDIHLLLNWNPGM